MSTTARAFVTDSNARYDPFGTMTTASATNPAISNHGFTGHRHNNTGANDLGLIYMNARYYMPEVGRFISPDTIVPEPSNPQSYNRYSYVLNSPMNYTDPTGHMESSGCDITDCTNGGTVNPNTYRAADGSSGISYAIPTLTQQPGQIIPTFHNPFPHLKDIASWVWSGITGD